jgi:CHAT domain-containing protein
MVDRYLSYEVAVWFAILAPLMFLAACQTEPPQLSVEQAKQVSARFEVPTATPAAPPRSIADVVTILDSQKPDEAYRDRLAKALNATPPSIGGPMSISLFYQERANAAMRAGLRSQAVSDAEQGVKFTTAPINPRKSNDNPGADAVRVQALMLLLRAKELAGENALGTAKNLYSWKWGPVPLGAISTLIKASLSSGDLIEAQRLLRESDYLSGLTVPPSFGNAMDRWPAMRLDEGKRVNALHHALVEEYLGHLNQAESWYRKAVFSCVVEADYVSCREGLVHILLAQDRPVEAETVARDALLYALRRTGRSSVDAADGIAMLGLSLYQQGRFGDAAALFGAEVSLRGSLRIQSSFARNALADALAMQGRWTEAIQLYDSPESDQPESFPAVWEDLLATYYKSHYIDQNERSGADSLPRVMSLYAIGRIEDGIALSRAISDTSARKYGANAYGTALAQGYVALGLKLKGDGAQAAVAYREVQAKLLVPVQPDGRGALENPVLQVQRRIVLEGDLEQLAAGGGTRPSDAASAFRVGDALRSGATDRALIASAARAQLPNGELNDLSKREQDLRQQLSSYLAILAGALSQPVEQQNAAALASLRNNIEQLKQAQATLARELDRRYPEYARLINPAPATVEQARAAVGADEALVALYAGEHETYVWALRKEGPLEFVVVPLTSAQLAERVSRLRQALDPHATNVGDIPPFDVSLAYELYAALLKPVESAWKAAKQLVVVPSGPLAQVPFTLLVTRSVSQPKDDYGLFSGYKEVPFLAREMAVSQVPSVAALVSLRALPPGNATRKPFVGFGDPWFSVQQAASAESETIAAFGSRGLHLRARPATTSLASAQLEALPRLADTAQEVKEVARALHADANKDVFLGRAANERQVRTMKLDDRRVIMFATHGLLPGDLDGLDQPALALSAPSVAGVEGDGLLTMEKILGLKLDADWVVLSACNTAAGSGAGAEAVSGLGRAFFYAGSRALLVTNWPVETTSARALTTATFQLEGANPSLPRAEALRESMLNLIDAPGAVDNSSGRILYSYAHPIFWAPFSLVGDGR